MINIQKVFFGVVSSISVAAVAVLGRPYLQQVVMSQQYQRKLSILAAEYRAALRGINRKADEIGTAFFESKRDYFVSQVDQAGYNAAVVDGVLHDLLETAQKVAAMELRVYVARQYLNKLRTIGAKHEAALIRQDLDDQIEDNKEVYTLRMRQTDFPIDELLVYLRQNIPKAV